MDAVNAKNIDLSLKLEMPKLVASKLKLIVIKKKDAVSSIPRHLCLEVFQSDFICQRFYK
jgi:hypothetical protein